MECFDISHISGSFVVASMVHFRNGAPDKAQYRNFKIKSFVGNDDFRAMREVVERRYRRVQDEQKRLPDLIVIDGGIGQVQAAVEAFNGLNILPPPIIGLAKKEESIVFPDARKDLQLPRSDDALRLLQRLRDEAHRCANSFNAKLRSQRIRESVLDDMPGLGPTRRHNLLKHFKSLAKIKRATVEELSQAEGIGSKFAEELHEFLQRT
jgi:excinuclease ABC subunit C